ncbi:hypothetical protein ACX0G7_19985 [Flavitalea antarctica]
MVMVIAWDYSPDDDTDNKKVNHNGTVARFNRFMLSDTRSKKTVILLRNYDKTSPNIDQEGNIIVSNLA